MSCNITFQVTVWNRRSEGPPVAYSAIYLLSFSNETVV